MYYCVASNQTSTYGQEPNNLGGDENCGGMKHDLHHQWNDIPCHTKRGYVCQRWRGISTAVDRRRAGRAVGRRRDPTHPAYKRFQKRRED